MDFIFHKYPQNLWARTIVKVLKSGMIKMDGDTSIVDAPSGNGIIGHFVHRALNERKIISLDNNPDLLNSPYVSSVNNKLQAKVDDIFEFKLQGRNNIWLFINSLYCLPFKDKLVEGKKEQFKYIIAVFPDIEASNFRYFTKKHPEFENPSAMTLRETHAFFETNGYTILYRRSLTRLKFHAWGDLFSKMGINNKIKNSIFTLMDYVLFFRKGQYELVVFSRNEENNTDI